MTIPATDTYRTIPGAAEAVFRDKGSKFFAFAYHVETEEEIRAHLDALRKKYYDATHHCYAWRLSPSRETYRVNDDGEPSSSAGKPILGQMLSRDITDVLVVVVRYFGGTKLGVPGLINAYRESAALALDAAGIEERTEDVTFTIAFGYLVMNDVMRIVKEMQPEICEQQFDNNCRMVLRIRRGNAEELFQRLEKVEGISIETTEKQY